MEYIKLFIKFADVIAWPFIVILIVLLFRKSIAETIKMMSKFKVKDLVEIDFGNDLGDITKEIEKETSPNDDYFNLINLALKSPAEAIVKSWDGLTEITERIVKDKEPDIDLEIGTKYKLIEMILIQHKVLDEKNIKAINKLRLMRNKVVHAENYEVDVKSAIEYVNISLKLMELLSN